MRVLEINDLHKTYGPKRVLAGLTFSIRPGEIYGLLGPNGGGKSTAINILAGLIRADAGTVRIAGAAGRGGARCFGIVPQEIALYPNLTCQETLEFFAGLYGVTRRQQPRIAEHCLREVALADQAGSLVSQLSGGMQRRMNLAVGMIRRPPLLVLDEPTVGLDLESRSLVFDLFRRLSAAGTSILVTSHQFEEVETLCSRIGILQGGRLAAEGTLEELRSLVPATEIAIVEGEDLALACERAAEQGLSFRRSFDRMFVLLRQHRGIEELAALFRGAGIRSISVRGVRLEDVYAEVVGDDAARSPATRAAAWQR